MLVVDDDALDGSGCAITRSYLPPPATICLRLFATLPVLVRTANAHCASATGCAARSLSKNGRTASMSPSVGFDTVVTATGSEPASTNAASEGTAGAAREALR